MNEYFYFQTLLNSLAENYKIISLIVGSIALIYWVLKPRIVKPEYFKKSYWERRYLCYNNQFEWYADTVKIFEDFNLKDFLIKNYKKNSKFLELGCGSSGLSYELAKLGYKNIFAIDYSEKSIEIMEKTFDHTNITYLCGDFFKLTELFNENEVDCILDKAGLDTINTLADLHLVKQKLGQVFTQMYKVLKSGGHIITISNKNPQFWKENIYEFLENKRLFTLIENKKSCFTKEGSSILMSYYFYILKKV